MSPYEILFGHSPGLGMDPGNRPLQSTSLCDDIMLHYCQQLSAVLSQNSQQVKLALPDPAWDPHHNPKPGDWVIVQEFRRNHWRSKRWQGPYQVLLTTHTAGPRSF